MVDYNENKEEEVIVDPNQLDLFEFESPEVLEAKAEAIEDRERSYRHVGEEFEAKLDMVKSLGLKEGIDFEISGEKKLKMVQLGYYLRSSMERIWFDEELMVDNRDIYFTYKEWNDYDRKIHKASSHFRIISGKINSYGLVGSDRSVKPSTIVSKLEDANDRALYQEKLYLKGVDKINALALAIKEKHPDCELERSYKQEKVYGSWSYVHRLSGIMPNGNTFRMNSDGHLISYRDVARDMMKPMDLIDSLS